MRRLAGGIAAVAIVAGMALALVWWRATQPLAPPDLAGLNDVARTAQASWPTPANATYPRDAVFTVVDDQGRVLVEHGVAITDPLTAAARRAATVPIEVAGRRVGTLFYVDQTASQHAVTQYDFAVVASVAVVLIVAVAIGWVLLTHHRIVRPFQRLEKFATQVAAGDLDTPLAMDRTNAFGAWTEAFDLMRNELAASSVRERAARDSKRDLISQLGHDIRTPVAAISASVEVLRLHTTDEPTSARLRVISAKAEQIRELMADLAQANEAELAALVVQVGEHPSGDVAGIVRQAELDDAIVLADLPQCLLRFDPLRLQQVIDNIVINAHKYAGTLLAVDAAIDGEFLNLRFTDSGPGLPADEVASVFGRGVRGSNASGVQGSGLGLYTAAYLMERMGGTISARGDDGFSVVIGIPLA